MLGARKVAAAVEVAGISNQYAVRRNNSPEQLPRRGNIIVEYTANKGKASELPVVISVTIVSSGANSRHLTKNPEPRTQNQYLETLEN